MGFFFKKNVSPHKIIILWLVYISLYVVFYCLGARLPVICIRLQFALYLASNASPQCRLKESRLEFFFFGRV